MHFIKGLLLGFTLQLSIGPVFFAVLHKSIKNGFREALKMVIGVTFVDGIYILISFTGISLLLKISLLKEIILIFGALILFIFGIMHLKKAHKSHLSIKKIKENASNNTINSFLYGIGLTAINPLTIIFWSGVYGSLIASSELVGYKNIIIYSTGCLFSTIIFLSFLSLIGNLILKRFNNKLIKVFDYIVGIILILFSIKMIMSFPAN